MAQYLYRIRPARLERVTHGPTQAEAAIIAEHADYLQSLTERGLMLVFGRTQNRDATTFGIAIFQADSEAAARRLMENDPAVKGGVMLAELFPYRIAGLNADGWQVD
jgi:uncharacterized protein YciI